MSGRKLDPRLKAVLDPIYNRDKERYKNLCRWVWWCQRGWKDEVIIEAVRLAGNNIHAIDNWWAYLTYLLPKASARVNEREAQSHKTAPIHDKVRMLLKELMK